MNDWVNISVSYPRSYAKVKQWIKSNFKEGQDSERDLYDFFDENGITILLTCEFDFGFEILEHRYESIIEVKKWYNSRKEAESAAFIRAFEILEQKLNN